MELTTVGAKSFIAIILGMTLSFVIPIVVALIWKIKKKERTSTILVGAATFLLFALILEKPIQALVIYVDNPLSRYLNANPVLWALVVGLFPGIFEETGRLVAFRTLLKNRKNRETSISHGIGHGCFEVMYTLGVSYITYLTYAVMINAGTFSTMIDQAATQVPNQANTLIALAQQIQNFAIIDIVPGFLERVFAVLFHIGASMLVFYACKNKEKLWLYPLAILLHTVMDFLAGLTTIGALNWSIWAVEGVFAAFGILTFCLVYFILYRKDTDKYEIKI